MKKYQFKIKQVRQDHSASIAVPWEQIEPTTFEMKSYEEASLFAQRLSIVVHQEVRWNEEKSLQGHYCTP